MMTFRDSFVAFPAAFLVAIGLPSWAVAQETTTTTETSFTETTTVTINETYDVNYRTDISVTKDVEFVGSISIDGAIDDIDEAAFATIDNKQIVAGNRLSLGSGGGNDALVGEGAVSFVQGNVGLLVISGVSNVADNAAAIAELGGNSGVSAAEASVTVLQDATGNELSGGSGSFDNAASIEGDSVLGISGNVGVAVIAGAFNIGKNALAIAHTESDIGLAEATVASAQSASTAGIPSGGGSNTASIGATAIQGITGNTGVVVLSGVQNLGANSLSIAAKTPAP